MGLFLFCYLVRVIFKVASTTMQIKASNLEVESIECTKVGKVADIINKERGLFQFYFYYPQSDPG